MFFPIFWGKGGSNQTDTILWGGGELRKLLTNYDIAKFPTKKVTEFPVKKYKFFPFFGGKGGVWSNWHYSLKVLRIPQGSLWPNLKALSWKLWKLWDLKLQAKKTPSFSPFWGGRIKLTLLFKCVENPRLWPNLKALSQKLGELWAKEKNLTFY